MKTSHLIRAAAIHDVPLKTAIAAVKTGALPTLNTAAPHAVKHITIDLDSAAVKTWLAANKRK
mgnify:CR=1 FL=1|jgi:hypothetical protein